MPSHDIMRRAGAKRPLRLVELPEWHSWTIPDTDKRIVKWIESNVVQPVGNGQGELMSVAAFQRRLIKQVQDSLATFISIPAGNGKTTLMAGVGLERISRGDDYVEVDVLATKEGQAQRLIETMVRMIEASPRLAANDADLYDVYRLNTVLKYRPTGSTVRAHPAKLAAIQGLNFNLALIDEIGEVPPELVTAMIARLGKRPDQHVIGFGTPGFGPDNMLEEIRELAHKNQLPPGVAFVEFAAEAGCSIYDEEQQRKANPAIEAGFLDPASLPLKAATMPEHEFRAYHLGQPVATSSIWLPHESWERCPHSDPPQDGQPVVLAMWGNYRRTVSICGATLDGSVFFGWEADKPLDDQIVTAVMKACEQWDVVELTHKRHVRLNAAGKIRGEGVNVEQWPSDRASDVESTAALYQAITFQEIAHDHHPVLAEQVTKLVAQIDRQGNPRLMESEEVDVASALAMRAAWWRARILAEQELTQDLVIL